MIRRVLQGDPRKISRVHDFEGRVPPAAAWLYLPLSLATTLLFKLFGWRAPLPWLGFRAIRRLKRIAVPGARVLEFGSGMSTLWFAKRGVEIVSIEIDPAWHQAVRERLGEISNPAARVLLEAPPYAALASRLGGGFDLALIDGEARDEAAAVAVSLVRPGGYFYLDNADVPLDSHRRARDTLLAAGPAEWFTDFTPLQVTVNTGLLVQRRPAG
jgi:predicted O-methyltransferase YrrM